MAWLYPMSGLNESTSKSLGPSHFSLYLDVTFNFLNCICSLRRTENANAWPSEKSVSLAFPPIAACASTACAGWAAAGWQPPGSHIPKWLCLSSPACSLGNCSYYLGHNPSLGGCLVYKIILIWLQKLLVPLASKSLYLEEKPSEANVPHL